jgi:hypothetical protein
MSHPFLGCPTRRSSISVGRSATGYKRRATPRVRKVLAVAVDGRRVHPEVQPI